MKMSYEEVKASRDRDSEYAATHKMTEPGYSLPSGVDTLLYISGGEALKAHYRQLVHLKTGEFIAPESVYIDSNDMTWNVYPPNKKNI
jgi:hypothetical protein